MSLELWICSFKLRYVSHVSAIASPDDTFLQDLDGECIDDLVAKRWKIGPGGITRADVIIIGAVHVSAGSWMPILQLNRYVF